MAPLQDQAWLQRVVARLEGAHQPRLKLPRMADSRCLEALGYTLMDEAMARLAEAAGDLAALLGYRDGLLIALLAAQPLRPRNPSASALPVTYSGTLRSSAKHYNQARSIDASRLLTRVLAQHRIAATTKPS